MSQRIALQVLVPPLRELEAHIFQQLFQHMWSSILMEGVTADQLPGAQPKHWIIQPSREEEAIQRWIDGFQASSFDSILNPKLTTSKANNSIASVATYFDSLHLHGNESGT